jgi:hypothetical protein
MEYLSNSQTLLINDCYFYPLSLPHPPQLREFVGYLKPLHKRLQVFPDRRSLAEFEAQIEC